MTLFYQGAVIVIIKIIGLIFGLYHLTTRYPHTLRGSYTGRDNTLMVPFFDC